MIPRCDVQSRGSAREGWPLRWLGRLWGGAVRQHEQTTDSTRRAWCWIILGITLALSPIQAWSQAESVDPARSAEPIDLAAGSIRLWNQGADQWLLLQGKVAILQGLEGVRANQAVIRVTRSETPTGATHRLDVYAEGQAQPIGRPVSPLPVYRTTLVTDKNVRFKPYDNKAVAREAGPRRAWRFSAAPFRRLNAPALRRRSSRCRMLVRSNRLRPRLSRGRRSAWLPRRRLRRRRSPVGQHPRRKRPRHLGRALVRSYRSSI